MAIVAAIIFMGYKNDEDVTSHDNNNTNVQHLQKGTFDFGGNPRDYMVFLPKNYTGTQSFPLVIYLHSYGWTAQQGMSYTKLNLVADTAGFIVAYPSGNPNWNSGIADNPEWPIPDDDDVGFINALIDTLGNHYSIDTKRVYACGYSNGGFMAYKLACELSNRIAAIASVGGVMTESTTAGCNPVHTMPVLDIHGTEDWWVPFDGTGEWKSVNITLNYWTGYNNCLEVDTVSLPDVYEADECTVVKISYTNCTNNSRVILYKVINGGHTWPGAGLPGFSHQGNVDNDFKASAEIWRFFKNYKLEK